LDSLSCGRRDTARNCILQDANIYELLTRPERFDGKRIRVIGYVHWDIMGDDALYPTAVEAERDLAFNAIGLVRPDSMKAPRDEYVLVEGTFRIGPHGHLGSWRAGISSVTRLERWELPPMPPPESIPEIDLTRPIDGPNHDGKSATKPKR